MVAAVFVQRRRPKYTRARARDNHALRLDASGATVAVALSVERARVRHRRRALMRAAIGKHLASIDAYGAEKNASVGRRRRFTCARTRAYECVGDSGGGGGGGGGGGCDGCGA